jgi:hypothetical protein
LTTFSYIEATTGKKEQPSFEAEPSDDELSFKEALTKKGYLTEHEALYYGSKQFDLSEVPIRYE